MGSQLEADLDKSSSPYWWCVQQQNNYTLWFDPLNMMPFAFDCWKDNMVLHFDPSTNRSRDTDGVRVRERSFGDPASVSFTSPMHYPFSQYDTHSMTCKTFLPLTLGEYFDSLIKSLVAMGYREQVDLWAAPYDWRKAPRESNQIPLCSL